MDKIIYKSYEVKTIVIIYIFTNNADFVKKSQIHKKQTKDN